MKTPEGVRFEWWDEGMDIPGIDINEAYKQAQEIIKAAGLRPMRDEEVGPIAFVNGRVVGVGYYSQNAQEFWIGAVAVDPAFQGRGIGSWIIQQILSLGKEVQYELYIPIFAHAISKESEKLLSRFGFEVATPLKNSGSKMQYLKK